MKLIECYIENFGKISKEKFAFKDKFNCIQSDNGTGKTTLATFIKVMLYGMSDSKRASLDENERKHYLPWQGGVCGGSLTFEAGGKVYRVERKFGSKPSEDSYELYDTARGRLCNDFSEGLGEGLFGIDADGFERTVFLSERSLTPKSSNKSISAKLSDLVGCDGDIGGMDDALELLDEKRKFYYKKGGAGALSETKEKIDQLTRRLDALDIVEKTADEQREKMLHIGEKIAACRAEAKVILNEREAAAVRAAEANHERLYRDMIASIEQAEKKRAATAEIFGEAVPTFTQIDEAAFKSIEAKNLLESTIETPEMLEFKLLSAKFDGRVERSKIEEAREAVKALDMAHEKENDPRLAKARRIFAKKVPASDEIDSQIALLDMPKPKAPIGLIITAVLLILAAIVFAFISLIPISLAAVAFAAICLMMAAGIKNKANAKREKDVFEFIMSVSGVKPIDQAEAKVRLRDMREILPLVESAYGISDTEGLNQILASLVALFPDSRGADSRAAAKAIIKEYDRYSELAVAERYISGDRSTRNERAKKLQAESDDFIKQFKTKTSDPFSELRAALTEYDRISAELSAKRAELARLESLNSIGEGSQKKAVQELELLGKRRQENDDLISSLSREHALAEKTYNSAIEELDGREALAMRRNELEELLAKQADNYNTVMLTKKYLALAKDNMTSRYIGKTKAGFTKYTEIISGITSESFEMSTDFGVTKQEGATTRAVEAYSRGTRDLYNLAARLGLIDSLYEKEKPFILLDDPFTAFDDKKTAAALKVLSELAKEKQIIYFTCSKSRSI